MHLPSLLLLILTACTAAPRPPAGPASPADPPVDAVDAPTVDGPPIDAPPDAASTDLPPTPLGTGEARPLTDAERTAMTGVSWREGCPVPLDALRVIPVHHNTPDGGTADGELIVHSDAVDDVRTALDRALGAGFPLTSVRPVRDFGGDDDRSMAADNTSGFNCRPSAGSSNSWSQHAYGRAIDLNPLRNPYVRGDRVDPPAGRDWLDRTDVRPGMTTADGPMVTAFRDVGWGWGGTWASSKDYQHVSRTGR